MTQDALLQFLAKTILKLKKNSPILIGIDGVDASGKTTLADKLSRYIKKDVIRASIDGFHNPSEIRYSKGENSSEGYYYDSFNYQAVKDLLLNPLKSGYLEYQTKVFDYQNDSPVLSKREKVKSNSILIMDGIFLFRPELISYWDLKIFIDVDFQTVLERVVKRNAEKIHIGTSQEIIDKYHARYIPGQKIYLETVKPKRKADIVIDNNNFESPKIIKS